MFPERLWAYVLIAPATVFLLLIVLVPEMVAMGMAFTNYRIGIEPEYIGVKNFINVLSDPNFTSSVIINVIFVFACVGLQMLIGVALALHMAKQFKFQRLWIALIMAPAAFTPSVLVTVWKYILHYQIGLINYFFDVISVERIDFLSRTNALTTVILISAYRSMPFVFMFVYPARTTIPQTFYESAAVAGAGWWAVFRYITLPLLMPAIYVALIFRTIFTLREFAVPWLLTKGGPQRQTELLAIYLFQEGFQYNRLGSAASVSWLILMITFVIASYQIYRMYQRTFVQAIAY